MKRQIDTALGLLVGGIIGYLQNKWAFLILLFSLVIWGFLEDKDQEKEKMKTQLNQEGYKTNGRN